MDCRECHERFRADKVIEDWCAETGFELPKPIDAFSQQEMKDFVEEHNIPCPTCGKHNFTDIRQFNLMFKTFQGVTEDAKNTVYLRPETAQGIFVNFNNVQRTTRKKLPFGIGQIGKSFRNEITPGNFIFRVREFEQMELEFFCKPGTDLEWFNYWRTFCHNWLLSIGLKDENLRLRDHDPEELCFYSKATTDFEFLFPFGWGELWGVADRTDYDLTQHQNTSGVKMVYREGEGKDMVEYVPYVIEPSLGVERSVLAVLCDAYDEEVVGQDKKGNDDVRVVLHFHPALAPFKAAILPLSKKDVLAGPAMELYNELSKEFMVDYDETGSIGKRYRREDEIGTPYCITFDFDTVGDEANGIKSGFILYDLIFLSHRIFRPDHAVVASVGVPAGAAAEQGTVKLAHSPVVGIAEKRQHLHQIVLFRKFRIWALRKMVSRGTFFLVVRLGYIAEAHRMLRVQLAVPFPHSLEDLVDQPHVKAAVQVKNLSRLYKSRHKKARDKLLQFLCRRMVRQQRVQGEDHDAAVDCEGMAGLFSTVVRELFEIFAILAAGRLPELFPLRFSVSRVQPRFYLRAKFWHIA